VGFYLASVARGGQGSLQLEVKLFSGLEKHIPGARSGRSVKVDIIEHFNVRMLLERLGIPEKEVSIILVNGINKGLEEYLADGDCVSLIPLIDGG
jgi:molybdopterin synthase sulfur carrier subunit